MSAVYFLGLLLALLVGVLAGCCYEGVRAGGTVDLAQDLADLEGELVKQSHRLAVATGHPCIAATDHEAPPTGQRPDLHLVRSDLHVVPRQVRRG